MKYLKKNHKKIRENHLEIFVIVQFSFTENMIHKDFFYQALSTQRFRAETCSTCVSLITPSPLSNVGAGCQTYQQVQLFPKSKEQRLSTANLIRSGKYLITGFPWHGLI